MEENKEILNEEELGQVSGGSYTGPCFPYIIRKNCNQSGITKCKPAAGGNSDEISNIPTVSPLDGDSNLLIPAK